MLQARARSEAADVWFPDATMGLPTIDDLEDQGNENELRGEVVAPTQAAPARDFAAEAETLKQAIADAAASKNAADQKAVRELFKKFESEAPEEHVLAVKQFYNLVRGSKKDEKPATPAAATQAKNGAEYLPPNQRGDSYEGPDQPPTSFAG
jgi:hypothetical protein